LVTAVAREDGIRWPVALTRPAWQRRGLYRPSNSRAENVPRWACAGRSPSDAALIPVAIFARRQAPEITSV